MQFSATLRNDRRSTTGPWTWIVALVLLVTLLTGVQGAAFFSGYRQRQHPQPPRQSRSRTYDEIARVINPNPYANVGGTGPVPAQPFWTYAGRRR